MALTTSGRHPAAAPRPKLTLGPVLYHWKAEHWRDFHFKIADEAPVDAVCIGEVVCAKRVPFIAPHLADVIERLRAAGKEVVLSTPALVMGEREMALLRDAAEVARSDHLLLEANDLAAVAAFGERAFAVGPTVNVYNEGTLGWLARHGAVRVCLPPELTGRTIATLAAASPVEIEVFAFGRAPLALSARCYHARARGLSKDGCQFVCADDPDGMTVDTLDGQPFLAVNGIQTLSHVWTCLAGAVDELLRAGVNRLRLSPQSVDMVAVARVFCDALEGRCGNDEAAARIAALTPGAERSDGFWRGRPAAPAVALAE
jgi:collagenase-like PrtC family protease